jgi:hypothetical protein
LDSSLRIIIGFVLDFSGIRWRDANAKAPLNRWVDATPFAMIDSPIAKQLSVELVERNIQRRSRRQTIPFACRADYIVLDY